MVSQKKRIWGWYFFDWASQPYNTLLLTFIFGPYFAEVASGYYLGVGLDAEAAKALLAEAGTDKSKLLTATIWLADMADFAGLNSVWDKWVVPGATPTRACVESKLAAPQFTVEIAVTAAVA